MSESAAGRGRPTQLRIKHTKRERERERRERGLSAIFLCSSAQPVRPGGLAGIANPKGFLTREGAVSGWLAVVGGGDNRLIGREDQVGGRGQGWRGALSHGHGFLL